ncbi:MAG: TolC family protein [Bacteroidales bacterium]|nr:TolC family protein [Bacteroidales bacterium]
MLKILTATLLLSLWTPSRAERVLSLQECRRMALESNREISEASLGVEMARYDKKSAFANYFPEISAKGVYLYNSGDINLISDESSQKLLSLGDNAQGAISGTMQQMMAAIQTNPAAAMEYMQSPMWQTFLGALSQKDVSQLLNGIGQSIDNELHPDLHNIVLGTVSLKQPLFVGGKIVNSNKMASLACRLSEVTLSGKREQVVKDVEQTYWQIVSLSAKKNLAEKYAELLHTLQNNVRISVMEGVATPADELQIKVKANEADMMKLRVENGLSLSKMLLCKQIGLPLDEQLILVDESPTEIRLPKPVEYREFEAIWNDRHETRSLALAGDIYDVKAKIAAADLLPQVALTANYLLTNPGVSNGFQTDFSGNVYAGLMVSIPIFHGFGSWQKVNKAKAESKIYKSRYEGAKELISLQVTQARQQEIEARERHSIARSNLEAAEENLRAANVGFEAGLIDAATILAAHTAWLQAKTDEIDAGIDICIKNLELTNAEGISNIQ